LQKCWVKAYISKYELGERRLDLLELVAICDAVRDILARVCEAVRSGPRSEARGYQLNELAMRFMGGDRGLHHPTRTVAEEVRSGAAPARAGRRRDRANTSRLQAGECAHDMPHKV
jgi:hypothetical protein